jgi:hypothetical protein
MTRTESRRIARSTHRATRPSLNPYFMDDTAFTRADILRDRATNAPAQDR